MPGVCLFGWCVGHMMWRCYFYKSDPFQGGRRGSEFWEKIQFVGVVFVRGLTHTLRRLPSRRLFTLAVTRVSLSVVSCVASFPAREDLALAGISCRAPVTSVDCAKELKGANYYVRFMYRVFFLFTAQKLKLEQGRNDSARTGLQPGETVRFWGGRNKGTAIFKNEYKLV